MATRELPAHGAVEHGAHAHAAPTSFVRKYIFSLDHKVIGIQYGICGLISAARVDRYVLPPMGLATHE